MAEEGMVSTRGLIDAELGSLRRFTGILDSMPDEIKVYGEGDQQRSSKRISLNFKDLDVKEAVEPYHFPTNTIIIGLSNRKKSRWGVLSEGTPTDRTMGFNNVADLQYSKEQLDQDNANYVKPADRMDMKDCIGKRLGMVLTDGEESRPGPMDLYDARATDESHPKGMDVPTPAWTVYEIEGIGAAGAGAGGARALAEGMLDGKALNDFNPIAIAHPAIRADVALLAEIGIPPSAPNSFANLLVAADKFTKDEQEVYHKV